jgi:hypothetical protein
VDAEPAPEEHGFLAGGGQMGARMRTFDWTGTPLGPPRTWPQTLRTMVRLLLNSRHPMFIWWGPELIQFYNDGYCLGTSSGVPRYPSAWRAVGEFASIKDIFSAQNRLQGTFCGVPG